MTNKHSINDLYQMQALSLASKIQMSKARILCMSGRTQEATEYKERVENKEDEEDKQDGKDL